MLLVMSRLELGQHLVSGLGAVHILRKHLDRVEYAMPMQVYKMLM